MNDLIAIIYDAVVYRGVLVGMAALAVVVWVALTRIEAPYGMMYRHGWGPSVDNRVGWVVMEAPAFVGMGLLLWYSVESEVGGGPVPVGAWVCGGLYLLHYFRRSFVFPLLMRGRSRMPWVIALMGAVFNVINVYLLGGWLFVIAPDMYSVEWLYGWRFVVGLAVFVFGMCVNIHSDRIVRHLRGKGERSGGRHLIPRGGMFRYVTAASYFGELAEWAGFALLTWSWAGVVFLLWTAANLVPRSGRLHGRYLREFGTEYESLRRRRVIPFIY